MWTTWFYTLASVIMVSAIALIGLAVVAVQPQRLHSTHSDAGHCGVRARHGCGHPIRQNPEPADSSAAEPAARGGGNQRLCDGGTSGTTAWQAEARQNFLLMHAMGANTAGQIGSAVAGRVVLALLGGA